MGVMSSGTRTGMTMTSSKIRPSIKGMMPMRMTATNSDFDTCATQMQTTDSTRIKKALTQWLNYMWSELPGHRLTARRVLGRHPGPPSMCGYAPSYLSDMLPHHRHSPKKTVLGRDSNASHQLCTKFGNRSFCAAGPRV